MSAVGSVTDWLMERYTNEEIGAKLGRKVRTVARKLNIVRGVCEKEIGQ